MLAIHCELLLGSYQAADPFGPASQPEWPPHPYRLHAALVGAACEAGGDAPSEEAVDALRWLERQAPPAIACSTERRSRSLATSWVPRNPTRGGEWDRYMKAGSAVNRVGRVFPTVVPYKPGVTFVWESADDAPPVLAELAAGVTWLGSSRSPIACAVVDEAPAATFTAGGAGEHQLRVASSGITDALLGARFTHPQPIAPPVVGYGVQAAPLAPEDEVIPGLFGQLVVRRVVAATQDAADAPMLGAALRAAVLSRAGDDAPAALHGHDLLRGHAAYITLPDVGHRGARGGVRGFGLALPTDVTEAERELCVGAFADVKHVALPGGRAPLTLDDDIDLWTLEAERWVGPARAWATVTPVVLDRFPRRGRTVEDEFIASLTNAGLPEPRVVDLLAGPPLAGTPIGGALRGDVPPGIRVHARIEFVQPVRGPVLAGRGRYRGVGLFAPAGAA